LSSSISSYGFIITRFFEKSNAFLSLFSHRENLSYQVGFKKRGWACGSVFQKPNVNGGVRVFNGIVGLKIGKNGAKMA
jgi:hypothetical protein